MKTLSTQKYSLCLPNTPEPFLYARLDSPCFTRLKSSLQVTTTILYCTGKYTYDVQRRPRNNNLGDLQGILWAIYSRALGYFGRRPRCSSAGTCGNSPRFTLQARESALFSITRDLTYREDCHKFEYTVQLRINEIVWMVQEYTIELR